MRFTWNTPPPRRGSSPNVGVLLRPSLSATSRFSRSFSLSPGLALGSPGCGGGAGGSPRSILFDAMYDDRSVGGGVASEGWVGCGVGRGGGAAPGPGVVSVRAIGGADGGGRVGVAGVGRGIGRCGGGVGRDGGTA